MLLTDYDRNCFDYVLSAYVSVIVPFCINKINYIDFTIFIQHQLSIK